MINVFIGYDPRQPVAYHALAHSIWQHAARPVSITQLRLSTLPITRTGLTEFTYSRFLVPHLSGFEGISIFVDSDFLCCADLTELLAYPLAFPGHSVYVAKNAIRFEWASLMVFNNALCTALTPDYVNAAEHALFDFAWAKSVGDLPLDWNYLVGYDEPKPNAKMVHYTQGVPCWPETKDSDRADDWVKTVRGMTSTVSFKDLMGRSVHAKPVYERLKRAAVHG